MKFLEKALFLLLFLFFPLTCFSAATLTSVRLSQFKPNVVRVVAETTENPNTSIFRLNNPSRLVVDFSNTIIDKNLKRDEISGVGFIGGIRMGSPKSNTTRMVLDLPNKEIEFSNFLLKPVSGKKWRFVLDLTETDRKVKSPKTEQKMSIQPFAKKKKVIILDPGHGGQDPGAISRSGKYEKTLTLQLAKETKPLLEAKGFAVVLTRTTDQAIPLRKRIEKAHKADGDLFISLHADSAKNKKAKGLSVYTISEKASDAEASALAERENKADIILGMDLGEYQPEIGNILIELAGRYAMDKSAQFAALLVKRMQKEVRLLPDAHRFAGFVVLKSPNIPSVLLEMGYLSNKEEEKLLQKKSYRAKLAKAIADAAQHYFEMEQ